DFVENQQRLVLVADSAQRPQPFAPEMVVSAFSLDRLNNNGRNVTPARGKDLPDLGCGLLFLFGHRGHPLGFGKGKVNEWTWNARPGKFREEVGLARFGVRQ